MNEKKIYDKLKEILEMTEKSRMEYFDTFPEDANEDRTSWSLLYDMAIDDYYTHKSIKDALETLIHDIDCCKYDD